MLRFRLVTLVASQDTRSKTTASVASLPANGGCPAELAGATKTVWFDSFARLTSQNDTESQQHGTTSCQTVVMP